MRIFIALLPPKEIIGLASMLGIGLSGFPLRLVKPENMDITLAFLGEIDDEDVDSVRERLRSIRFNRLLLRTKGYGFFPSEKKIRVVWLGLERDDAFMKLQHDIRKLFGHKEKFMPHMTIARAKDIIIEEAERLNDRLKEIRYDEITFKIDKFYLFSSELTAQGPIHKVLEEYGAE